MTQNIYEVHVSVSTSQVSWARSHAHCVAFRFGGFARPSEGRAYDGGRLACPARPTPCTEPACRAWTKPSRVGTAALIVDTCSAHAVVSNQ